MLLELVRILYRHGEAVEGEFAVGFDSAGKMVYTTTSESSRKRFIADFYGLKSTSELDDEGGNYPSTITPREMFEKRLTYYGLDNLKDENAFELAQKLLRTPINGAIMELANIGDRNGEEDDAE